MSRGLLIKLAFLAGLLIAGLVILFPTFEYWSASRSMSRAELRQMQLTDPQGFRDHMELQSRAIKRGLDLQGGVYLVLEVDPRQELEDDELSNAVEGARRVIEQRVNQFGVSEANVQKIGDRRLIIELPGLDDIEQAKNLVGRTALLRFNLLRPTQERDEALLRIDAALPTLLGQTGDSAAAPTTAAAPAAAATDTPAAEQAAPTESATPFEQSGQFDAAGQFTPSGTVEQAETPGATPSISSVTSLASLLQSGPSGDLYMTREHRGMVEQIFTLIKNQQPGLIPVGREFVIGREEIWGGAAVSPLYFVNAKPEMTGASVKDARVIRGSDMDIEQAGKPVISFEVKADSVRLFSQITRRNRGVRMVIILDDIAYSAPVIQAHITDGRSVITGMEDQDEANTLAIAIRSGALPAEVQLQEQRFVGPSLGSDSIHQGMMATIVGGALVIIFMLLYYRAAGVIAIAGLTVNMFLLMACMAYLEGTLTLPGVAGLILTIGMAIDANVLIFERIREELATGKTARAAIEAGYDRAASAIWDANITTFITAAVLYQFGTGPVRGFALILAIGIFTSVFSALFVTRLLYDLWQNFSSIKELSIGKSILQNPHFNFIKYGKTSLVGSGIALSLGVVAIILLGFNWGIDFAGGTKLEVTFEPAVAIRDVRNSLEQVPVEGQMLDLRTSEIKTAERPNDVFITVKQFPNIESTAMDNALRAHLAATFPQNLHGDWVRNAESVGPKIGSELKSAAIYSVIFALLGILIYVSIRFEWTFAVAATIALFHDVLFTLGVFSLIDHEISLTVVAAVLTIVGYSLNDTIVVFDRIREGLKGYRNLTYGEILDRCINETLSRTLITSMTTLVVVLALLFLAGEVLFDFALALVLGIMVGTYSSIYVAAAVLYLWQNKREAKSREEAADRAAKGTGRRSRRAAKA